MIEHRRYVAGIPVSVWCVPGSSSLNHLQFPYLILLVLVPNRRAVFQVLADNAEVGVAFGILTTRPNVASIEPKHAVGLLGDSVYECLRIGSSVKLETPRVCFHNFHAQ